MNQNQSDFLKLAVPAAIASMMATGVPASVTIAQAIFESSNKQGWGQSALARLANNYFGIKATHLGDPDSYIELPTGEYEGGVEKTVEADFARYPNATASFVAHAQLLSASPRYAPAMRVKNDVAAFARKLQDCGYSTNRPPLAPGPKYYADQLLDAIRDYDLEQYDVSPSWI